MAHPMTICVFLTCVLASLLASAAANECPWTGHHYRFGQDCEFQCHCRDRRERCDRETGNCTQSGCDEESIGPGCQYRNIARTSEVDANYGSSLGLAVDGKYETCTSQSILATNPFVRIALPYETTVTEVFIRFKNYTQASGFSVYVGVSTSRDQRTLCGTDPRVQTQDLSVSVVCSKPLQGRFVTIYLGGVAKELEVCEIGIDQGRYLSYLKSMYGSSQESNLDNAVNGRPDDHASTREQDNPWIYVDLQEEYEIHMVDIINKEDRRTDLIGFEVYISNKRDFSDAELIYMDFSTTETIPDRIAISVPGKIARFVRITIPGAKRRVQLREIWVLGGCLEKRCGFGCEKLCYCDNERMSAQGRTEGICTGKCDRNWFNDNGRCNTSVCQNGTFGYECAYQCNCAGMCHPWTGKCLMETDICDKHYFGDQCQGLNTIRESVFTAQGNTSYTSAAMTVDGLLTSCGPILAGQAASWTVPLGVEKPVDQIIIQVNENTTGYGFEVITENAANFYQCDTFRQGIGDRYIARCRNVRATHIRLRTRSTVQICEVAVLECADGTFGDLCERTCLCYNGRPCNKTTGACPSGGCDSGYYGPQCERECIAGTYGRNCERQCGQCKAGAMCDIFTGECPVTCQAGWQGGRCDIECRNGTYGEDCIRDCGWCLDGEACNKATGECPEGCGPGYFTRNCSVECVAGRYGYNCNETCGTCKNDQVCDNRDGYCRGGCVVGKMPPLCDADCDHGTYGEGCSQTCGDCRYNLTCDPITGVCQDGCDPGVFVDVIDPMCTPVCADGYFGYNCTQQCYEDLCEGNRVCNKSTGGCLKGCLYPGVQPPLCLDECCDGSYGYGCALRCGMCNNRSPCNKTTGECFNGCDPGFVGALCDVTEWSMQLSTASTAALVLGVVLAVLGLTAVGVALWIWKRNKSPSREYDDTKKVEPPPIKPHLRNASLVSRVYENNMNDYENVTTADRSSKILLSESLGPKGTVSVEGLWDYIQKMKLNKADLAQQFNDLATGLVHPCEAARKAQNIRKNRYKEIFPYDHTRVKLDVVPDDDGNDYINACYVSGYNRPHMYIAAQGPTEELVNDFWRMIWQKKCRKVVMLTRLVEHGKVKCCQYWPEEGGIQYGTIYVELKDTDLYAEYNIRTFAVSTEDSAEALEVKQYHFEAWPDRHVPDFSSSVIEFWGKVRAPESKDNTPLLVHCSAGIGRTGTFLALDYLVDQANVEGYVNIQQCVQNLRHQRVNMVQNQDQYVFLHDALVEALLCPGTPIPCEKFAAHYKKMLEIDPVTREPKLKQEFEKLQHVTKMYGKAKTTFEDEVLKTSNLGFKDSLPGYDKTGCSKPVFIPTYREGKRYLVAQTPAADTVVEFWQSVYEHGVTSIVTLDSNPNPTDVFLPALRETLTFMPFQLHLVSETHHPTHIERTLTLLNAEMPREKSRHIKQFECKFWADESLVPQEDGAASLLTVYDDVIKWQQTNDAQKPVLVHCMNGADKSGVFCVVTCAVERVKGEREVALLQTVKQIRTRRHQVIPSFEQYKFCHDATVEFLKSFDTYSNFFV